MLDTYNNNSCHKYFNDLKPATNTTNCTEAWDKIDGLASGLNWYDLFRKVYTDQGVLLKSHEERLKSVNVNGQEKTYKSGFTMHEYTPWAKHIKKDH